VTYSEERLYKIIDKQNDTIARLEKRVQFLEERIEKFVARDGD